MIFIEVPWFTRQLNDLVADDAYLSFQKELLKNPKLMSFPILVDCERLG